MISLLRKGEKKGKRESSRTRNRLPDDDGSPAVTLGKKEGEKEGERAGRAPPQKKGSPVTVFYIFLVSLSLAQKKEGRGKKKRRRGGEKGRYGLYHFLGPL